MKINNIAGIVKAYNVNPKENNKEKNVTGNGQLDKFQISQRAKDISVASKALSQAPDLRNDKIQHIKEQLEQGTYTIDPILIAQKMLSKN